MRKSVGAGLIPRPGRGAAVAIVALLALCDAALAQNAFTLVIKDHRFEPAELRIPAKQTAILVVENRDATPEEFEMKALRIEKAIPGKSSATFNLRALEPGRYSFVGEFHEDTAKGDIVAE